MRPLLIVTTQRLDFPDGTFIPEGVYGLRVGRRVHFDLGPLLFCGFGGHHLPVVTLPDNPNLKVLGPWDGSQGKFTNTGWHLNPILNFRRKGTP